MVFRSKLMPMLQMTSAGQVTDEQEWCAPPSTAEVVSMHYAVHEMTAAQHSKTSSTQAS